MYHFYYFFQPLKLKFEVCCTFLDLFFSSYFLSKIILFEVMPGFIFKKKFNLQISDEPTKSLGNKTECMPRAVDPLVNMFNCFEYDWTVKDE